ncbi:hypothetical protein CPA58_29745, partial [Klebsiella pneumoniae]
IICKKKWTSANENDYYCPAFRETLAESLKARHCSHCIICKKKWTSANENDYYCPAFRETLAESLKARH